MPTVRASSLGGPKPQFELADGTPAVGNKLFWYVAGSVNTKQNTYTDSTGSTANANPVVLNSLGMPTTEIWLQAGLGYKVVYAPSTDTDPPTSPIFTVDNLFGINDTTGAIDQWVAFGGTPTFVSTTSFTLVGDQTSTFTNGRRIKTTNSGGTIYSTILSSAFGAVTTIIVRNDSGVLDSGLSAVAYGLMSAANPSTPQATVNSEPVCNGRLTLTTGVPVTTAEVTAAETIYFTPYKGNTIDLYDTTLVRWVRYAYSELSLDVPDVTAMHDVFIYNNAGTLTLEAVQWTNDTTRATALVTQNGVYVKSGATTRRYLGSFYCTTAGNGQTEDSTANRHLWNYYNRVLRRMVIIETTDNWAYTTATWRQANASAINQLSFVTGLAEDIVKFSVVATARNSTGSTVAAVGVALNATNVNNANVVSPYTCGAANVWTGLRAEYVANPSVGRQFAAWVEYSQATGTTTWYGDNGSATDPTLQSGIYGEIMG